MYIYIYIYIYSIYIYIYIVFSLSRFMALGVENESVEQIAFADRIILNKTDLVDEVKLQEVEQAVKKINGSVGIMRAQYSKALRAGPGPFYETKLDITQTISTSRMGRFLFERRFFSAIAKNHVSFQKKNMLNFIYQAILLALLFSGGSQKSHQHQCLLAGTCVGDGPRVHGH